MAQKVLKRQAIKELVKKYGARLEKNGIFISQIYLYGSYAKGDPNAQSDIDICVISPQFQDRIESTMTLLKLRTLDELRLSPIAFSEKDFTDDNPLAHEIKKTGTTLQNEKNKKIDTASKAIAQHYSPEKPPF